MNRWLRLAREKESLELKHKPDRVPTLDEKSRTVLGEPVEEDNDATLQELAQRL